MHSFFSDGVEPTKRYDIIIHMRARGSNPSYDA